MQGAKSRWDVDLPPKKDPSQPKDYKRVNKILTFTKSHLQTLFRNQLLTQKRDKSLSVNRKQVLGQRKREI